MASITGETNDWLVGWGQGLCDTAEANSDDWTGDYSIALSDSDGTTYTTGLTLTCPKTDDKMDEISKNCFI